MTGPQTLRRVGAVADPNAKIQRNRQAKAARYTARFVQAMRAKGPIDAAAIDTAVAIVEAADAEKWKALAKDMTTENWKAGVYKTEKAPSAETVALIKEQLRRLAPKAPAQCETCKERAAMQDDRECFECFYKTLMEVRSDPELRRVM